MKLPYSIKTPKELYFSGKNSFGYVNSLTKNMAVLACFRQVYSPVPQHFRGYLYYTVTSPWRPVAGGA